ncbi:hypothetical protein VC83_06085, partial [Pseudogymnoascus destructans]
MAPHKKNNGKATAAAIPEARLTEAECLAAVDALLEKKNPMSRCEYCVEQHNKCLPIPTFALHQFNRLADAFQLYRDAVQHDEEAFSKTLANNRAKILAAVQEKYTAYVMQGKNLLRRRHRVGHDSQPQKVNLSLALLEIASEVQSLRCTTRLSNDLQKAIHRHLPDVALAEEYESSDSEDDADREHPMFQHAPYA